MQNKTIIALSILVLCLTGYLFYDSLKSGEMSHAQVQTEFNDLKTDYEVLQRDMEKSMNNIAVSNKVIETQQKKIENLLRKNAITEEELTEAKKLMREISQGVLEEYQRRVSALQEEKANLITDKQEEAKALNELQAKLKNLENSNKIITAKYDAEKLASLRKDNLLAYASKLSVSNFVLKGFKVRSSGREIETDRAWRIDRLNIHFDILENKVSETGRKQLFIVGKNPDGTIMDFNDKPSGNFMFEGQNISYSDHVFVDYIQGKPKTVELIWNSEDFKKGDYILEVYEKNSGIITLVGKATKKLE